MDFEEIRYELDGHLATITLNRPDRLNAFTAPWRHSTSLTSKPPPAGRSPAPPRSPRMRAT
jgi:hypothetical protein